MSDHKSTLQESIEKGESLANAALRKVFEFSASFAPETDHFAISSPPSPSPPPSPPSPSTTKTIPSTHPAPPTNHLPFRASSHLNDGKRHLLLACSGSVATIKLPNITSALSPYSSILSIRIILTSSANRFLQNQSAEQPGTEIIEKIPGVDGIYVDEDEWSPGWIRGAPILHIELRRWADLLVVAPLSANTLAKVVGGICDNLLTSVVRAWDVEGWMGWRGGEGEGEGKGRRKVIMVAPAMNSAMWLHPITGRQLKVLEEEWDWVGVLTPTEKALACGDVGIGAMKEWKEIVRDVEEVLELGEVVGGKEGGESEEERS